jgi:2-polyprenyl-3-methyl-5-hydroxy-6-metoxy-1,4-benzoquinol methylase
MPLSKLAHTANVASRIARKRFFSLLGRLNEQLQPREKYAIRKGYHHAVSAESFDDTGNADEWQRDVYEFALACMQENNFSSVIDVGCGSGYKLVHLLGAYDTTGIEVSPTFEWLKGKYPEKKWLLFSETDPSALQADFIICSDVIEHLPDPDQAMQFLQSIQFQQLLLSTPEREAVAGPGDYGPPENTSHYREWSAAEFRKYVSGWFHITDQRIFNSRSTTQILLCKKY